MVCQYAFCLHQDELKSEKDGFAICDPTSDYVPRNPADSVLYSAFAEHLETFLAKQRQRERIVPRFVELLAELYGASIAGRAATGPRAGKRIVRIGDELDSEGPAIVSGSC